jgi:FHS family L-fucose permease-like MFS transporter
MLNLLGGGGNRGNQLIQTGGSLNSLAATLTPMLAGAMIGEITKETSLKDVSPLLLIALAIFAVSFCIIYFTKLEEPETEKTNVMEGLKGALSYRHLVLGIIAIFFYVGLEVGIPGQILFYLGNPGGVLGNVAVAGAIAGVYWFLMLVGRFTSAFISGKVSSRTQLTVTTVVAIALLLVAIFMPESQTMNLKIGFFNIDAIIPTKVVFIILCGLCTSVMWGVIFNLATEGLGKYTASASGLFMTMVVGGGVMPLIQDLLANKIGSIQSYWLIVAMLCYLLFYALIGSRVSKKEA